MEIVKESMTAIIRTATVEDIPHILTLVNRFAEENLMLPRTAEGVARTLADWLIAVDEDDPDVPPVIGCGALIPLTETLVELRSLAVDASQHGKGLGGRLVLALVEQARVAGYPKICALTLRENFFIRLGFELVDRWSISPKVWQECIYCPKFHRCDEVAVLMNLADTAATERNEAVRPAGWNKLLKHGAWQPLKLAYQQKPDRRE